jgi:hypothetical protein
MTRVRKTISQPRTLQSILDDLIPFLKSIEIDDQNEYVPLMVILGYKHWEIPASNDFLINIIDFNEALNEIEISITDPNTTTLDDLVEFVYKGIVQYNEILEQKQAEINENIKRIEEEKLREIEEMKRTLLSGTQMPTQSVKQVVKKREVPIISEQVSIPKQVEMNPFIDEPQGNAMRVSLKDLRTGNIGEFKKNNEEEVIKERIIGDNADLFERDLEDE